MGSECPSAKKEPPWLPILPPLPRISVSTNSRARLSHRRPILSPPTLPPPPAAAVDVSASSACPWSRKSVDKSPESPILETFSSSPSRAAEGSCHAVASFPSSSVCVDSEGAGASSDAVSRPANVCSLSNMGSSGNLSSSSSVCVDSEGTGAPSDAVSRPGNVCSLSSVGFSGNLSSLCTASEFVPPPRSEECISGTGSHSPVSFPIARISSPAALLQASSCQDGHPGARIEVVGFGVGSVDGVNGAKDPDVGKISKDGYTSSEMGFAIAETTLSSRCLNALEEQDEYKGVGIGVNQEHCSDVCREAETPDLVMSEEVAQDRGKLEEEQLPSEGGNGVKYSDFGRSGKDGFTSSDMEITVGTFTSPASCHNASEEVDGCRRVDVRENQENSLDITLESEIPDLVKDEELVLEEGELEEGQLPGEWSGGEEADEDSEPAQMLEDIATMSSVPMIPMTVNMASHMYYPYQVEEFHSEDRNGGKTKPKGKKKKKHKKGEGSKKRSREKSKEKYNEVLKKKRAEGKGVDVGPNSSKDSIGRGEQIRNSTGTGKCNKVTENLPQTLPKKPTVDEGPEDGEILLESTKTNDGILSSLVEAEVGLWTTDDIDDQFVAEMDQDGAMKKKRGPETAERKLKRKIAKRKKRAQKDREMGIRRPPRTIQSKPVKVLCTHYMKGRCAKGDQCTYSHDAVPLTKQEPCKFLMSHSCLKGDDCPYSHDLQAFPCKFFHTRGLCYDGEKCQFSHGAISEEALAKLKQRVEKEKKERISTTSALDIPTPSFSTPLPPELDPDPLGWGTPNVYPAVLDQSTHFYGDFNLENHVSASQAVGMMPRQSVESLTSIDRKETELDAADPPRIVEKADEYKYIQLRNTKALESIDLRRFNRVGESSVSMGPASTEGQNPSIVPEILKTPVCPSLPNERSNARKVLEVPRIEEKMDPGQSPREEPLASSNESAPQNLLSALPSLASPLLARSVVPMLRRGRHLGSLVLEHERVLQSPLQAEPKRQHTVDSLLDEALRQ